MSLSPLCGGHLVKVETSPDRPFEPLERALREAFRVRLNIRVAFARAEAGSLPRYELKARRFKRIS